MNARHHKAAYPLVLRWIGIPITVLGLLHSTQAEVIGYVANPTSNSTDWQESINSDGAASIQTLDFEEHPIGALQETFYQARYGVTLTQKGLGNVTFGSGPGEENDFSIGGTKSAEGYHEDSNYVLDPQGFSTLTISFDPPVFGAGLFVIDYFNPGNGINRLELEAFDGPNATGELLGSFLSTKEVNFQKNKLYFMGITDTTRAIQSIVFTDIDGNLGDRTGIDDIMFAR